MFFRNQTPKIPSFDERISGLAQFSFTTQQEPGGGRRVIRKGYAAVAHDLGDGKVGLTAPGVLLGGEIAGLVNLGYEMILRTPSGKELAAQASQLQALHAFDEDLREGLGLTSLYNVALGTTTGEHLYDRVADRDQPHHHRPWEH